MGEQLSPYLIDEMFYSKVTDYNTQQYKWFREMRSMQQQSNQLRRNTIMIKIKQMETSEQRVKQIDNYACQENY